MKRMHNIFRIVLVLVFLAWGACGAMAQYSQTKNMRKGFKVSKTAIVEISNKYGDIELETWQTDSVLVEISIEVSDKTQGKVHDKLRAINFDLSQSGNYVIVSTLVGDSKNLIMTEFNRLKENVGVGDAQMRINMKVKVPDNLKLKISNKFGNIYLPDYNGEVQIELANGKLKANDLNGHVTMKVSFGNAMVGNIDSGNLEVYYGELNLTSARKLRMITKTSDITITEIGELRVNSTRDEYRIRMVDEFETDASWTDFNISEFRKRSDIRMNYGDLRIDNILPSIESLFIDARSTKINLYLASKTEINFDITANKMVNLPTNAVIESKQVISGEEKTTRYIGRTGKTAKSEPNLILKTKSGDVTIIAR